MATKSYTHSGSYIGDAPCVLCRSTRSIRVRKLGNVYCANRDACAQRRIDNARPKP